MKPGEIEIPVQKREVGRGLSKLRKLSRVPGVVYGTTLKDNLLITAEEKVVVKYGTRGFENTIFTLKSNEKGLNDLKVLVKEISRHPISRKPIHVDLLALDMNKPVRVFVELRFEGKAVGLSEGGVLETLLREVEIETLPANIPEFLAVDVSALGVADTLHVSDIKFPANVKSISAGDLAIVTVAIIKEEAAAPTPAAGAAPAAAAEPEVIGKGKKDEKAEGAAPAAGAAAPAKKDEKKG